MLHAERYKADITKILEDLPEEKAIELTDFARFLNSQYSAGEKTVVDESTLRSQQKAFNNIWNNSEEDLYEL